jgi:hypothetical protein
MSISNSDADLYGNDADSAIITLDFKGLGLPEASYKKFNNLLNIVSNGAATCLMGTGGMCLLPGTCSSYSFLDEFNFKVKFASTKNDTYFVYLPLNSFAIEGRTDLIANYTVPE